MPQYLFILVLLGALWFMLIRPAHRRQKAQQQLLSAINVGDEVVTAGGLYGTVRALEDDEIRLEIAPGTEVRVARRAVAGVVSDKDEGAKELEAADGDERATEANLSG